MPRKERRLFAAPRKIKKNVDSSVKEKRERFDNSLKVVVKNIPLNDEQSNTILVEHLTTCGPMQHTHFYEKKIGTLRLKMALAVFSSEDDASRASELTGTVIGGRHIIVSRYGQFSKASSSTIFVSNLPCEVDEEDLWNFFEDCGTINYIHIERLLNASSLKGEVHFKSSTAAVKAKELDGRELKGQSVLISAEPLEEIKESLKEFPVFVAGLPLDVKKESILQFFDGCGPVKRIKIMKKDDLEEAHAVVFFMDSESSDNALSCNGNELAGCVISVTQREEGMFNYNFVNPIFIAGISKDTKDVDLFFKFQDCGLMHDVKFVHSKPGQLKKAVVEFKDPISIERALAIEDLELNGQNLIISRSREIWSGFYPDMQRKSKKGKSNGVIDTDSAITIAEENIGGKKKKKRNSHTEDNIDDLLPTPIEENRKRKNRKMNVDSDNSLIESESASALKKKRTKSTEPDSVSHDDNTKIKKRRKDKMKEEATDSVDDLIDVTSDVKKKKKKQK